jgi:hypothetical protein
MVTTLIARAHAPAVAAADLVLGPVSTLFHRQVDALEAMARAAATLARPVVDTVGPGGVAALAALVVVPVLLALLAIATGTAKALAA